jgi:hypothetical protein
MTDVLERGATTPTTSDDIAIVASKSPFDLALSVRIFLATASAAAGVIHLVMVPSHWGESTVDGLGFAIAGWLQLAIAAIVLVRPTALALKAGLVINAAAIGAWIYSRTAGFPWGAQNGVAEDASFIDVTCVVLEALFVIAAIVALVQPKLGSRHVRGGLITAIVASIAIFGLTTSALAAPSTREHGAAGHHDATTADGGTGAAGHAHPTPGGGADDKGFSLLSNGQHEHMTMQHTLDAPTQAELDRQLAITREVAKLTPTVAAAETAGYSRVGPYFPGIGAHYWKAPIGSYGRGPEWNGDGIIDDNDLRHPLMLIFDGTKPTSKIAGFMYYSTSRTEPAGFAGRNDTWHIHENLCLVMGNGAIEVPFGLDHAVSKEQCQTVPGATMLPVSSYMVHVWSIPGYEMTPEYGGVFGEENPTLACADGTYYQLPIEQWADSPMNVCVTR